MLPPPAWARRPQDDPEVCHRALPGSETAPAPRKAQYAPTEKIKVIEVANFPMLGKLTALRFIEWVLKNPGGVISLPTGKTPEHFIKWVTRIIERWDSKEIQALLGEFGIDGTKQPDMRSLKFVQIDEFYPMDSSHHNSFHYYVTEYYLRGFGIPAENALLINSTQLGLPPGKTMNEVFPNSIVDLTLRVRQTRTDLERLQREVINHVDEFCAEYETRIREMGGIGFFLGGIGPDGHVAFNVRGSSHYSVTRLTGTNYETQAAAATDLGGIEVSRTRLVITIGLATITANPTVTAIVSAAGEAKAKIVADAVQKPKGQQYPGSCLQGLPFARFYLTRGAARDLVERQFEDFSNAPAITQAMTEDAVVSLSLAKGKRISDLDAHDFQSDRFAENLVRRSGKSPEVLTSETQSSILAKIEHGLAHVSNTVFLHTEPHHDDIMLGYLAYIYHLVRDPSNQHFFANLTSGFTSVSNAFFLDVLSKLEYYLESGEFVPLLKEGYFEPRDQAKRMEDVYLYLDGQAAQRREMEEEASSRRLLRNLIEYYHTHEIATLKSRVRELIHYLETQYPGAKDPSHVQLLKGMIREFEVELLWAYYGIESDKVFPLRLGFYTGDIFTPEPEVNRDALPILGVLRRVKPNVVSVAFDPEGSGPDTHYKALQAVSEALKLYVKESGDETIRVWGYRNVWYRYRVGESNIFPPVSLNTLSMLHTSFMNCFGSQSAASFPSYEHDGPFSELAQQIQVDQYNILKTCLGKEFFLKNEHPRLRAARGMIYLKEMSLNEFFEMVRELKKLTESR
jgi:glucosamine-6-phosphate deaminase